MVASMRVPSHAFREYDIRGVADRDLSDEVARGIGQGYGTMLGAPSGNVRVAVGRDCRLSSDAYAKALAQLGKVDDAVKYFDQVLAARPDVLVVARLQA